MSLDGLRVLFACGACHTQLPNFESMIIVLAVTLLRLTFVLSRIFAALAYFCLLLLTSREIAHIVEAHFGLC